MIAKLNKRTVDATRPSTSDVFVWEEGFGLKVTPKGRKIFLYQYWSPIVRGQRRRVTIGTYGKLTVDQARVEATKLAGQIAKGEDPAGERISRRVATKEATVKLLSTEYIDEIRPKKRPATIQGYEAHLRLYILPVLGRKPVADVTFTDVTRLHSSLSTKKPVTANRVVELLSAFMMWAERRGYRAHQTNPCYGLEMNPEQSCERFLTVAEIARLSEALRLAETVGLPTAPSLALKSNNPATRKHWTAPVPIPADPLAVAAIRFLLLTGWREQEALTLRWSDVDFARGFATLPATKTGKSHRPIGAPALLLLSELDRVEGNAYVFPGAVKGESLKEIRRTWYAARHAADLDDVRLHDLRHTVASFAVGAGVSLFLTGALLGHSNPSTTKKYAHLADDARRATADAVSGAIADALRPPITSVR